MGRPGQTRSSCERALSPNTSCIPSLSTDTQPCLFIVDLQALQCLTAIRYQDSTKKHLCRKATVYSRTFLISLKTCNHPQNLIAVAEAEGHTEIQHLYYCNYQDLKNRFVTCSTGVMGGYDLLSVVSLLGARHLIRQIWPYFWFILPLFQSVSQTVFGKSTCLSSIILHQQISRNFTK